MAWLGIKRKRSSEEQKAYEEKVYNIVRDKTIVITERIFRFTRIDRGIRRLQVFTENHRRATVAFIGGAMTGILVFYVLYGNLSAPKEPGAFAADSIAGKVAGLPSYYGSVFRTNKPQDFVERVVREMKIDTVRYRTDSAYRVQLNREFLIRYGRFDEGVFAVTGGADSLSVPSDSLKKE